MTETIGNSVRGLIIVFTLLSLPVLAQVGGRSSFEFLNAAPAARLAALGGVNVSAADRDLNFFTANPSLAGDTLAGMASASYQFYTANIGQAFFSYAHPFRKIGPVIFGVQHMDYGTIQGYDASGIETGVFKSGETALMIAKNQQVGNFRFGATVKSVFSSLAGYRASALLADLGGLFLHPDKTLSVGLTIKNAGVVLNDYTTSSSHVPFDVQFGATLKPEHMPMRFSLTGYQLTRKNVTYFNSTSADSPPGAFAKVISHFNLGAEILVHRNVNLLAGYNFLAHQALKLAQGGGGAGFNAGFSVAVRSVDFVFSRSGYVAGNAAYSFTLSTDIQKMLTRR